MKKPPLDKSRLERNLQGKMINHLEVIKESMSYQFPWHSAKVRLWGNSYPLRLKKKYKKRGTYQKDEPKETTIVNQ